MQSSPSPTSQRIASGKYALIRKIGSGAFGEIYSGTNVETGESVAVKLEHRRSRYPQLLYEARLIKLLGLSKRILGIPRLKWYGVEGDYNVMVMDLLGPSLEDNFNKCNRKFSLKTVLMLADQMIKKVEYIHGKNFLHRDIKPDNFLMGTGKRTHIVYMIDFGLAKKYRDSKHVHIPFRANKSLTGTARYCSINNHMGMEQSRRDDLQCLGYIFMYFLRGSLPWQGLRAKTKEDKYERICEKKTVTPLSDLCAGHPEEFKSFLEYSMALGFEDKPDYAYLRKMLQELFIRKTYKKDFVYDFTLLSNNGSSNGTSVSGGGNQSARQGAAQAISKNI
eukprot:CAMPEP_0117452644 /NCGR_PEP_ID=MMETSP0759-20121206/9738_1 /TAXON_ID=63605 /ORGANISM="Percolomonas cosmopolitus, Strain WS" /LENGTH=334 /DNA_ID=CAMNT_0005245499 /DNA_START=215 /DNA_END=1219 /DNA_ORIENTATION=-